MDLKTINGELQEANPSLATIVRTEDNIVVFKVFIEYKDENISKETLIENFATFGKIQDYSLIERQNGDKIFKVTYFNPLSAARLLHNRFILSDNLPVTEYNYDDDDDDYDFRYYDPFGYSSDDEW